MSRQGKNASKSEDVAESVSCLDFDYGSLAPSVASFLKGQADRIRRQCVTSIVHIGKALIEAKRHLTHGEFIAWVQTGVLMPVRTAQAYMRIANWAADKGATVAHLSPTVLHLLSAASTPPELTSEILRKAEAGELIAPSAVRRQLEVIRQQKCRLEHDQLRKLAVSPSARLDSAISDVTGWPSLLREVVDILRVRLTQAEFERVREIFMSGDVLSHPELLRRLRLEFSTRAGAAFDASDGTPAFNAGVYGDGLASDLSL